MEIFDISQPIFGCKVFAGDTVPSFVTKKRIDEGFRLSDINMCLHNGTHLDAPSHFLSEGADVSKTDLRKCVGSCAYAEAVKSFDASDADKYALSERILIDGHVTVDGAEKLVANGVKLIGTASQSIASTDCDAVHKIFAEADVVVLEGLVLKNIKAGNYFIVALPLNFNGLEASPIRAVLIR